MTAIGYVAKNDNSRYKGELNTKSIPVTSIRSGDKGAGIMGPKGVEIVTVRSQRGDTTPRTELSLSLAASGFGPCRLYGKSRPRR
jgi:hypothetical protein